MNEESAFSPPPWLNPTAASLLGFLYDGEHSGYELVSIAEQTIGRFWSLTRSQVYRELSRLDEEGLVQAGTTGARSRRPYQLTVAGRKAFAAWLAQPPGPEQIRHPLLLTVAFGAHVPTELLQRFLGEHHDHHARQLAAYQAVRQEGLDPWRRATLAFGMRYEQAMLDWINGLPALLSSSPRQS